MDDTLVIRTPIKVKRKSIDALSKKGYKRGGGWFAFNRPDGEKPPRFRSMDKSDRVLFCPYCADWHIFTKDIDIFRCTGACGWGHTGDFYVKCANDIWWENVPLASKRKIGGK